MKIRYYADAELPEWHDRMVGLLRTIHEEHGIEVEIERVEERFGPVPDFPGTVREAATHEVYERDFSDHTELFEEIGWPTLNPYGSGDGLQIAGHVAMLGDRVRWASTLQGDSPGHGPGAEEHTPIDFLEDVAASPSNRVCTECLHLLEGSEKYCPNCGNGLD